MRVALPALGGVVAVAVTSSSLAVAAPGDATFDGKWKQGPLEEQYTVQQWLPGCGPAPVSGAQGGGEAVSVHQEGDELSFVGGGRVYRTNQCYDQLPTLARDAHSRDPSGRAWRTRCTTPAADPRRGMMQTLVVAKSDTHIDVLETGRYEISLAEGRCVADVKRSRAFDLIAREGAPSGPAVATAPSATAPSPSPPPAHAEPAKGPASACGAPGEPALLEVRPSRKLMRTGESFTFRAVVSDANGCATSTRTTWAIAPGGGGGPLLTVDAAGKVTVQEGTAEGTATLVASAAGKSARVTVDVTAPAHYDDLLARSGLNAAGENDNASIAELATGTIGGGDTRVEDGSARRRFAFVAVVGLLALGLGVAAFVFSRRARRASALEAEAFERHAALVRDAEERRRSKSEAHAAQVRAHHESLERRREAEAEAALAEGGAEGAEEGAGNETGGDGEAQDPRLDAGGRMVCPACRRAYPAGGLFCPEDASRLVPMTGGDEPAPAGAICPACQRGFDPSVKVCPFDQEELVPYAMHAAALGSSATRHSGAASPPRGKICPTCGGRFDGSATFCGKDGTALVMLN